MFTLYSNTLKVSLGVDRNRVALLGVAYDVDENLGLLPRVLYNWLHPTLLLLTVAGACLLRYGTAWLFVSNVVSTLSYWMLQQAGENPRRGRACWRRTRC
jgi:hypothetical protein